MDREALRGIVESRTYGVLKKYSDWAEDKFGDFAPYGPNLLWFTVTRYWHEFNGPPTGPNPQTPSSLTTGILKSLAAFSPRIFRTESSLIRSSLIA